MGLWKRWARSARGERGEEPARGEDAPAEPPPEAPAAPPDAPPTSGSTAEAPEGELPRGLGGWLEKRAKRVVREAYESHAGDLEERALRVVSSVYEKTADDLEQRAVRAMRSAIEAEAERLKQAIEHGIAVKKREVRLSLLVLVVSSVVYLALYWFTSRPS